MCIFWIECLVTFSHSLSFPVYFFLNWLMFFTRKTLYSDQEPCNDSEVREGEGRRVRGMQATYISALGLYDSPALRLRAWTLMLQTSRVALHLFSTFHLKCPCFQLLHSFSVSLAMPTFFKDMCSVSYWVHEPERTATTSVAEHHPTGQWALVESIR